MTWYVVYFMNLCVLQTIYWTKFWSDVDQKMEISTFLLVKEILFYSIGKLFCHLYILNQISYKIVTCKPKK